MKRNFADIARQAAAEGCVLLKNDKDTLPLVQNERISVFGRIQFDYYKSGTGSGGLVNTKYVVGILDALQEEKLLLNQNLMNTYRLWLKEHPFEKGTGWAGEPWSQQEMELTEKQVEEAAKESEKAIIIIGRTAGEDRDATASEGSYLLTKNEEDMLEKVCRHFEKTVVVLNVGNIIDMKWVRRYQPAAVLYAWQGGQEGGHGVADVLMGRVNPCGKLSDTIAQDISDYPSTRYFGGENGNVYAEDIYVGYRYFETFAKDKVLYPFGFGLSYSKFVLSDVLCNHSNHGTNVKVTVTNIGESAGKEVVQLYVNPPQGKLGKPVRNLVAFAKTKELQSGEMQELVLEIKDADIASYDDSGCTGHKSCFVLESGVYEFYLGTDVRNANKVGEFIQDELVVVEQCQEAAAPREAYDRMKPIVSQEGSVNLGWEPVPLRTYSMNEAIQSEVLPKADYKGDMGYKLADVYEKNISMKQFLAQISDDSLCHLVKGEGMCSFKVTPGTASAFGGITEELKNFGIPCGCCADGPSGIRLDIGKTAFSLPNGTCLACSFNEQLQEELYEMEGAELRKNQIDTLLGPGMNIHRNPLNGRNFEYFSEDPYLTGKIAAAQLRGMHTHGVTGTIKHFVANNQETNRNEYDSIISERALREIYLRGYRMAIDEGGAYSIMTTYGIVNGVWTAGNYDLLTTILRKEWGYDGMVMTDWYASISDEDREPTKTNLAAMIKAQNDIYMVVPNAVTYGDNLKESLDKGILSREALVRCAANICNMLMRTPAMDRMLGNISDVENVDCDEEDMSDMDIAYYEMDDVIVISGENICTERGSSAVYGLDMKKSGPGPCQLTMRVRVEAEELAQISVSAFMNGILTGSAFVSGMDKEWTELDISLGYAAFPNNYIRIYFAQSGMKIDWLKIERKKG